jgi:hypothetical protein
VFAAAPNIGLSSLLLIKTRKLNNVVPIDYLTNALSGIFSGHLKSKIDDLLP